MKRQQTIGRLCAYSILALMLYGCGRKASNEVDKQSTASPVLSAEERRQGQVALDSMSAKKDEVEGVTWLTPKRDAQAGTSAYLYIGEKEGRKPWLRLKIRYRGSDWLFIRRYRIKVDQADPIDLLPTDEIKTANGPQGVSETFDEDALRHQQTLNTILAGRVATVRMEGTNLRKDMTLSPEDLQSMRDVLLLFRFLGGSWKTE